jgi:Flp pilus assembly protein TadD
MAGEAGIDRPEDALRVAEAYFETANYARAREVLRRSLAQHPNDPALLAQHARAEYLLNNHQGAAWSAYAALSAAPHDEMAMRIYALSLDGLGRLHDALWMAWRGVIAHPNEPLQHRVYARLLQKSRQFHSALLAVEQALRLKPASPDTLVLRGSILHDLGRIAESDAAYQEALALDPGNAEAINNIAVNRLKRGKFAPALRGFLGAAGSDPTLGDLARRNIGVVLVKLLKWATLVAMTLCVLVASVGSWESRGNPTVTLRWLTGLVTVALIAILGWLVRAVPRRTLISVLRDRYFGVLRIVHAVLAAALGAGVTVFGGPAWTIGAGLGLIVVGLVLFRVGLSIGM